VSGDGPHPIAAAPTAGIPRPTGRHEGVTEIRAVRGLVPLNLRELWEFRDLVLFLLWRDVAGRYRQMALGPLWILLSPVTNMVLFTVIFGQVARLPSDGIPYPLFSFSALLPWTLFSGCLFAAAGSLLSHKHLISKVYFPRLAVPLVGALSALADFLVSFVVLVGMMLAYGFAPGWQALWLPVFLLLAMATGLAVGLWWASWIVHYYDLQNVLGYLVRVWMYATPVVYASSLIPERWRTLYRLNPMTGVTDGVRWCLLGVGEPRWGLLGLAFAIVLPVLVAGAYYFRNTERSIVDIA
jgi:lipopolysaccharide transport system permease protein